MRVASLALFGLFAVASASASASASPSPTGHANARRQDGPVDPGTASDCTYFDTASDSSKDCKYFEGAWFISHADFVDWNPSVKSDCSGLKIGNSYCVEVNYGLPRSTTTTAKSSTTKPTTTKPVETCNPSAPSPTQAGVICGCEKWHKIATKTTCASIYEYYKLSPTDFHKWSPAVGTDCKALWLDYYVCVGIPGTKPTSATSTKKPVETCNPSAPSPTQAKVVCGCKKWHKVATKTTCDSIYNYYKISAADFHKWNPAVGTDCKALWLDYYVCVGK